MKTKLTHSWSDEVNFPVTICDTDGIIVYMNQASIKYFENYGGEQLVGQNLLDCHPEPSKSELLEMLIKRQSQSIQNEKDGQNRLIVQTPWYNNGEYAGLIELIHNLPKEV